MSVGAATALHVYGAQLDAVERRTFDPKLSTVETSSADRLT